MESSLWVVVTKLGHPSLDFDFEYGWVTVSPHLTFSIYLMRILVSLLLYSLDPLLVGYI
jgi:hypothetical protein